MRRALLLTALVLTSCAEPPAPVAAPPAGANPPASAAPAVAVPAPAASGAPNVPAASAASTAPAAPPAKAAPIPGSSAPAPARGTYVKLTDAEQASIVAPRLHGRVLTQPALRGAFGPSDNAVVAVVASSATPAAELGGFVVLPDGSELALPKLHDAWTYWEPGAILFEDADGDGARELIVLADYMTGAGPTAAVPFTYASVVRWDGKAFVRAPEVEERLSKAKDAAAVRKALKAPKKGK